MANILAPEKRLEVLAALVNGSSVRSTERMTGVHRDTVMRFGALMGEGCARLHDRLVRDLSCALVDLDEQHGWCGVRQARLDPAKHDAATMGEQWTWAAICRTSKLIIAWSIGKRTQEGADALVADVRARLLVMPQITTDGLGLYPKPIAVNFGHGVDYVQTIKRYTHGGGKPGEAEKFAVPKGVDFIEKKVIFGAPNLEKATTYAIERSNLTNRQWNARARRRTLSFSKDLDHHRAAVSLMFVYRNLCWIQRNMRETPAMAAGVTDHVWELGELLDAALEAPAGEKPRAKPLTFREPEGTSRALPAGRGFLRVVGATGSPSPAPMPPAAPTPAAATSRGAAPMAASTGQLDLLAWRPRPAAPLPPPRPLPPVGTQLEMFGDPPKK